MKSNNKLCQTCTCKYLCTLPEPTDMCVHREEEYVSTEFPFISEMEDTGKGRE